MGERSKIEWTDATFNPWMGCEKIAPECDHCYAEKLAKRMKNGSALWNGERRRTSWAYWLGPLKWARTLPAKLGRRPRVFCASLADVFDKAVPQLWRDELFDLIAHTPELDWLLLTKRIGNAKRMLPANWGTRGYANVWLGITAGSQATLDRDLPKLLALPARVKFVSMEPMLGPVWFRTDYGIDWVIVGGESGPGARPFNTAWARDIVLQCRAAEIACFVKQLGARPYFHASTSAAAAGPGFSVRVAALEVETAMKLVDRKGGDWTEWPADLRVREFPVPRD